MKRRDTLKLAGLLVDPLKPWAAETARSRKRVLIAGAGIAGLVCAYELTRRGHEAVVLEASNRTGGHVKTVREGLTEGLYADAGGEHFTKPGYDLCWGYFKEFDLPVLFYPHREKMLRVVNGRMVEDTQLDDQSTPPDIYLDRYIEKIKDEYQPFGVGLDDLDGMSLTQLLQRDGAPESVVSRRGSSNSALHSIWKLAILRLRNIPTSPRDLYRIQGGNQKLADALAGRLSSRIHLNSPVSSIRHDTGGVVVTYREGGQQKTVQGDYLVCCMNAIKMREIPVSPTLPESKQYALANITYTVETRLIFESATKFWRRDGNSGNMVFGTSMLGELWPMAEEVHTDHGLLIGNAQAGVSAKSALSVFQKYYSGKSADIQRSISVDWSRDPWSMTCEAQTYLPGQLHKIWPAIIEPVGRVHFAGAYCDNQSWGMEAASRSGFRVARAIDNA